ncbi:AcrR family transcriptional regulator [Streptosporangium becharense]|uniref:AcrR family transcriptional regulator n=1 Tax=Streptosporangium becharense TaxID=1816182 RepID=A0A7W9MDP2_9ACTN|nr:TetR/AcrR family transcriptional regulator [Streptosporangium becharense]MBB2914065.1 AcrR family transcriptional regulator [Streptosporangium becharense]MBB5817092.1 AcrR family transcriptional regulator [Streptosporangium becharense]
MADATVKVRRTQVERRAHTRAALIEAAVACVNIVGPASVSTAQIAATAGVTRGAVQHHFGSAQELYLAVVNHAWEEIAAVYRTAPGLDVSLDRRITGWGTTMVQAYTHPAALAGYEILVHYRGNAGFMAEHTPMALAAEQRLDELWVAAFTDTGLSRAELVGIRHTARTFMLGAVARRLMIPETDADLRRELTDLLRAFLPARQ